MERFQRGWVAVWFLVVIALVVTACGLAGLADGKTEAWESLVTLVAASIVALGLVAEFRRDPWEVAAFGLAVGVLGAVVCGLIAYVVATPAPAAAAGVVAGLVVAASCGTALFRMARGREQVPNVLGDRFGKGSLLEIDGVQLAVICPAAASAGNGALQVCLQNCFDSERKVELKFDPEAWGKRVVLDPRSRVKLAPLEVGVLTVPFRPTAGRAGTAELTLSVSASGLRGRRIRRWRARSATRKVSPVFQVIAGLAGHIVRGGGIQVRIDLPETPEDTPVRPLPAVAWQSLWRPARSTPLEAARAAGLVRD